MASASRDQAARGIEDTPEWQEVDAGLDLREEVLDLLDQPFQGNLFSEYVKDKTMSYYAAKTCEGAQASVQALKGYLAVLLIEKSFEVQMDALFNVFAQDGDEGASDGQGLMLVKLSTPLVLERDNALRAEFSFHPGYAEIARAYLGHDLVEDALPVKYVLIIVTNRERVNNLKSELDPHRHIMTVVHRARDMLFGVVPEYKSNPFPYATRKIVINAGYPAVFGVCCASEIPQAVRHRSMFMWLFPHLGYHWKRNYQVMTLDAAIDKWAFNHVEEHTEETMMAIIGLFSVGYCFSQQDNIAKQIETRMRAVAAQIEGPTTDVGTVNQMMIKSKFKAGESTGDLDGIIGYIVAIDSKGQWNPEVLSTELEVVSKLARRYNWDAIQVGVYTQLRLVAQQFRSTSVRFACGGIKGLEQLKHLFGQDMKDELVKIKRVEEQIRDRWYTGCVENLPQHLQIATHKVTVYFGLKYFEAGLDDEERIKFKKYAVEKIGSKLDKHHMKTVENWAAMAAHNGLISKLGMIRTLPIDGGDRIFREMDAATQAIVIRELAADPQPCTWYQCYQAKIEDELILKTREVVKKKLEGEFALFMREMTRAYAEQLDEGVRERIRAKQRRVKKEYETLLDLFGGDKYDFGQATPMDERLHMNRTITRHAAEIGQLINAFRDLEY